MDKIGAILKANRSYVIDTFVFLVAAGVFSGATYFLLQNLSIFTKIQNDIASLALTDQVNDQALIQYNKSNIASNSFLDALPTQDTIILWLRQTETMSGLAHVDQTVTFTNAELTKNTIIVPQSSLASGTPTITANIVLKGSYNGIVEYVNLLNHSYYYTHITSMTFSAIKPSTPSSGGSSITPTPVPTNPNATVTSTIALDLYIQDASAQATQ